MIWLVAPALAADPLLDGLPGGDRVTVDRGAVQWTIGVDGRTVVVPAPRTELEEAGIRALIASLLSGLDLVPVAPLPRLEIAPPPILAPAARTAPAPAPAPVPVVLVVPLPAPVPAPPPPPPPAPAPVVAAPPPPTVPSPARAVSETGSARAPAPRPDPDVPTWWIGTDLVARPEIAPGVGLAMGAEPGKRGGVGVRAGLRLPREALGSDGTMLELDGGLEVWGEPSPGWRWAVGGGAAGRRYAQDGEEVAAHVIPQGSLTVLSGVDTRLARLSLGVGLELDLATTRIGFAGEDHHALNPAALRIETRIAPRSEPVREEPTDHE